MAARTRKVTLTDDWRQGIRATNIVHRLYRHSLGEVEMTKTQIDAAKVVLAKILPDLKSIEQTTTLTGSIGVVSSTQATEIAKAFLESGDKSE